jgi:hypothetical protein
VLGFRWYELFNQRRTKMNGSKKMVWIFVAVLFLVVAGGGVLIYWFTTRATPDPELMMGILVVVSIATLMTVLFILAAGFSSMDLTDRKQALGLPEGSIRAMIALVLIMVFIIFGIFLFRKVGVSSSTWVGWVSTTDYARIPTDKSAIFEPRYDKDGKPAGFNVYVQEPISEEGKRLAQQLITTVGTLVVAIASFYFGTTMASTAAKKEREEIAAAQAVTAVSNPMIKDVTPKEGGKGQEIPMEITGTDFKAPRLVQLLRGSEAIVGTGILSTATNIKCKVKIDKEPGGKWDVIVLNEDGKGARLPEVFTITQT